MIITRVDGTKIDTDRLWGGGDPYAQPERTDPRAIAEQIPRLLRPHPQGQHQHHARVQRVEQH